jgi:hypothetical protein
VTSQHASSKLEFSDLLTFTIKLSLITSVLE